MLPLQMLYFEDLSVGMTETLSKVIDASDVVGFAEVTGDRNPIHLSEHFRRENTIRNPHRAWSLYGEPDFCGSWHAIARTWRDLYFANLELSRAGQNRRYRRCRCRCCGVAARKISCASDLQMFGRRRGGTRRGGLGEGAIEGIRRPSVAEDLNKTAPRAGRRRIRDLDATLLQARL